MDRFPSRIYSAGLILRPGMDITPERLTERLDLLGYRRAESRDPGPGEYRTSWNTFTIRLRNQEGGENPPLVKARIRGRHLINLIDEEKNWLDSLPIGQRLLGTFFGDLQEERVPILLEETPIHLRRAILTIEDRRFRSHPGVDPFGIARALFANLRSGRVVQGGSTITQQLAKNLYGAGKRTVPRKIFEMIIALDLEFQFTKDEILEAYLNDIYLGQRGPVAISGVGAAAEFYFGKPAIALTLSESALLAGLIKSPGKYNPRKHPDKALQRRDLVIERMAAAGQISAAEGRAARDEPLGIRGAPESPARGSYLTDFLRRSMKNLGFGRPLPRASLVIRTSIETDLQEAAEAAVHAGLKALESSYPAIQKARTGNRLEAGLIVLDPGTGAILAMVGGRDYRVSQFNRVDQARRQSGSLFKPFVYLAGFEMESLPSGKPFTPATILEDTPLEMLVTGKHWQPQNYDRRFRGEVTVRQALEKSLNVPTVRAAQSIGLDRIVEMAARCGIQSPLLAVPSIALGTMEVSPLEMASGFSTIANGGRRLPVSALISVSGPAGRIYTRADDSGGRQAVSPQAAFLVTDILRGVVDRGTARRLRWMGFDGDVAAKTGTSDGTRDAWFVGYTPQGLALVWVGYDDAAEIGLSGSQAALPIWLEFIRRSGWDRNKTNFPSPGGIESVWIDPASGERATGRCPARVREHFIRGTEPAEYCHLHGGARRKSLRWLRGLFD